MASSASNPRASLLSNLRTGGVRSASQPFPAPHSGTRLSGQFNIPRAVSNVHPSHSYFEEEEEEQIDQLSEMTSQFTFDSYNDHQAPMTAHTFDSNLLFQQQQQQQLLLNRLAAQHADLAGSVYNTNGQQIDLRSQMMQLELLKYQVMQQQSQYQAELAAQAQVQTQRQLQSSQALHYPRNLESMSAAPNITSFDHRANAIAQLRARQLERLSIPFNDDLLSNPMSGPMSASIDGKFGSRALNPHATSFLSRFGDQEGSLYSPLQSPPPVTLSRTTVISGGTSLGSMALASPSVTTPSKSDAAVSWRRGVASPATPLRPSPVSNSVIKPLRMGNFEENGKNRPRPLNLLNDNLESTPHVQYDVSGEDDPASGSSKTGSPTSASTPPTPPPVQPLMSTEPKKAYENLGFGRPTVASVVNQARFVSLPSRQPRGPPSGADELGSRNFASRIRRQAIGGLEALVTAREQRELAVEVQAY